MKPAIFFLALSTLGLCLPTQRLSDVNKILLIMKSEKFTISIDRSDLGYFHNFQKYDFERLSTIKVTHQHLLFNLQDSSLNQRELKIEVVDSLAKFCQGMKSFEIERPEKFRRRFNKSRAVIDEICVSNNQDTVRIYDLEHQAVSEIYRMIKNNLKCNGWYLIMQSHKF